MPARRLAFYNSHTVLQVNMMLLSTRAILAVCDGITNISAGNLAGAVAAVQSAQDDVDAIFALERQAEWGTQWHGMCE